MTIYMSDDSVARVARLREFVKLSSSAVFSKVDQEEVYEWIGRALGKFRYFRLVKKMLNS